MTNDFGIRTVRRLLVAAAAALAIPAAAAELTVALDPGHGGIDPGAVAPGLQEKAVTLGFARRLAARLREDGHATMLTREDDRFLPLQARVARARAAGADLMLSIHADSLQHGDLSGASVYVHAAAASDAAAARLAARENAAGRPGGGAFGEAGSDVARMLVALARPETVAASRRLAERLTAALSEGVGVLPSRPLRAAAFRVLEAPDFPSALIELGFLSSAEDRARLADPAWAEAAAEAVARAVGAWAEAERGGEGGG